MKPSTQNEFNKLIKEKELSVAFKDHLAQNGNPKQFSAAYDYTAADFLYKQFDGKTNQDTNKVIFPDDAQVAAGLFQTILTENAYNADFFNVRDQKRTTVNPAHRSDNGYDQPLIDDFTWGMILGDMGCSPMTVCLVSGGNPSMTAGASLATMDNNGGNNNQTSSNKDHHSSNKNGFFSSHDANRQSSSNKEHHSSNHDHHSSNGQSSDSGHSSDGPGMSS